MNQAKIKIRGVVANAAEIQKSYYYRYRYGYGYGYTSGDEKRSSDKKRVRIAETSVNLLGWNKRYNNILIRLLIWRVYGAVQNFGFAFYLFVWVFCFNNFTGRINLTLRNWNPFFLVITKKNWHSFSEILIIITNCYELSSNKFSLITL